MSETSIDSLLDSIIAYTKEEPELKNTEQLCDVPIIVQDLWQQCGRKLGCSKPGTYFNIKKFLSAFGSTMALKMENCTELALKNFEVAIRILNVGLRPHTQKLFNFVRLYTENSIKYRCLTMLYTYLNEQNFPHSFDVKTVLFEYTQHQTPEVLDLLTVFISKCHKTISAEDLDEICRFFINGAIPLENVRCLQLLKELLIVPIYNENFLQVAEKAIENARTLSSRNLTYLSHLSDCACFLRARLKC